MRIHSSSTAAMRELSRLRSANASVAVASSAVERENTDLRAKLAAVSGTTALTAAAGAGATTASQWRPR